ncbi:MAG: TIM barrel protein [Ginsengibacter sp.]
MRNKIYLSLAVLLFLISGINTKAQNTSTENNLLFSKDNLLAWCIVPYDSKKRNAEERAAMLKELGITSFVYDWRALDLPNMEHEFATLKKYNIALKGVWFWVNGGKDQILDDANEMILKTLAKTNTKTELWVCFPNKYFEGMSDEEKIQKAVKTTQYIHERATEIGCTVALYNHEDWFGEPANEVKIIEASGFKDVGIIYNFHHGHSQVQDFDNILKVAKPYLTTVNLNGMKGDKFNILPLGEGDYELEMMEKLKTSGFAGDIGIIGHTDNEDVKVVLERNLTGLKKLLIEMGEKEALKSFH